MPILKVVNVKPNNDVMNYVRDDNSHYMLAIRHPHDKETYSIGNTGLANAIEYIFTTRDALDAYLNDPDRWAKRDEANAHNTEHGIITRLAVLDGENSGPARFDSTTSTYVVTTMSEAEAEAWVTEIVGSVTP